MGRVLILLDTDVAAILHDNTASYSLWDKIINGRSSFGLQTNGLCVDRNTT